MPALSPFDYAIIRVVPSIERGECLNVGVVLFCRTRRFLDARVDLETRRLALLAPALDREDIRRHLELIPRLCAGGQQAGPIGLLPMPERFHWLVAPRSTIIQPSQVHSGLCADPAATLERLFAALVLVDAPPV
jgi:hypothetical protein